jgi:hypothetical protein
MSEPDRPIIGRYGAGLESSTGFPPPVLDTTTPVTLVDRIRLLFARSPSDEAEDRSINAPGRSQLNFVGEERDPLDSEVPLRAESDGMQRIIVR